MVRNLVALIKNQDLIVFDRRRKLFGVLYNFPKLLRCNLIMVRSQILIRLHPAGKIVLKTTSTVLCIKMVYLFRPYCMRCKVKVAKLSKRMCVFFSSSELNCVVINIFLLQTSKPPKKNIAARELFFGKYSRETRSLTHAYEVDSVCASMSTPIKG